ncbi:MAG: hypothetical protein NZZ41_04935 [Candidatus Dojkabacteria bacterium]|nr:hypothetical protein [Candidatus Dojkabacteria bacterium]
MGIFNFIGKNSNQKNNQGSKNIPNVGNLGSAPNNSTNGKNNNVNSDGIKYPLPNSNGNIYSSNGYITSSNSFLSSNYTNNNMESIDAILDQIADQFTVQDTNLKDSLQTSHSTQHTSNQTKKNDIIQEHKADGVISSASQITYKEVSKPFSSKEINLVNLKDSTNPIDSIDSFLESFNTNFGIDNQNDKNNLTNTTLIDNQQQQNSEVNVRDYMQDNQTRQENIRSQLQQTTSITTQNTTDNIFGGNNLDISSDILPEVKPVDNTSNIGSSSYQQRDNYNINDTNLDFLYDTNIDITSTKKPDTKLSSLDIDAKETDSAESISSMGTHNQDVGALLATNSTTTTTTTANSNELNLDIDLDIDNNSVDDTDNNIDIQSSSSITDQANQFQSTSIKSQIQAISDTVKEKTKTQNTITSNDKTQASDVETDASSIDKIVYEDNLSMSAQTSQNTSNLEPDYTQFLDKISGSIKRYCFIGLNTENKIKFVSDSIKIIARELSKKGCEFNIDSLRGYGTSIIDGCIEAENEGYIAKVTGYYLKPFFASYSDESNLFVDIQNYTYNLYSNSFRRMYDIVSASDIFLTFDTSGINNYSLIMHLLSIAFMYKDKSKSIIVFGRNWKAKVKELLALLKLREQDITKLFFAENLKELFETIACLEKENSTKRSLFVPKIIDNRDQEEEKQFLV